MHNAKTDSGTVIEQNTVELPSRQEGWRYYKSLFLLYWSLSRIIWAKAVAILLTLHALFFMYQALRFIFIEYPELEFVFESGQASAEEIRVITAEAITVVITVFLDVLFAIRLTRRDEDFVHFLDLLVATGILIFHGRIMSFFLSFDLVLIWRGLPDMIWFAWESLPF